MFLRLDRWWLAAVGTLILVLGSGRVALAGGGAPPVPEPAEVVALLGMGGVIAGGYVWRRLRRKT